MDILGKNDFLDRKDFFKGEIMAGKVFIYGTDSIYGIGCNALDEEAVARIRVLKHREDKPFSVIAPSMDWIRKNCYVGKKEEKWLGKLPGAYTLVLELRNWEAVSKEVNSGGDSLGVRIPNHWFSEIVSEAGVPFVTTSVNVSGEEALKELENMDSGIRDGVDYFIDEGVLGGRASTIVKLIDGKEEIIKR
jgi:L-threonylcarbamoyladenylate synthase